ncbi:hypothetical protein MAR_030919 [Mya arenaria]|uniref:Uncharacterized protein n=1 Tax=Mya arenaria TaxID=6604 RepID=A0ABY7F2D0_MYAAR|nr:hypothetical protein MAR_030919 [Mya arenaria]
MTTNLIIHIIYFKIFYRFVSTTFAGNSGTLYTLDSVLTDRLVTTTALVHQE